MISLTIAHLLPRSRLPGIARSFDSQRIQHFARGGAGNVFDSQTCQFYLEPLSDSLAELRRARALIGKALAIDIYRGGAFDAFFFDLRSEGLGDQQPGRDRHE
jgi:hypothetical protein